MIKARASGSKVYPYFMKKGRQARHRILRNSCLPYDNDIAMIQLVRATRTDIVDKYIGGKLRD